MDETVSAIVRTAGSFVLLLIISVFFGRAINAHKNHFNMAMAITIGSLVANMGFNINLKFMPMAASFFTMVLIYYVTANLAYHVPLFRHMFSGSPSLLVENGQIVPKNMAAAKLTEDDLNQHLREKDVFSVLEVRKAILEPSGFLSVEKIIPSSDTAAFIEVKVPQSLINALSLPSEVLMGGSPLPCKKDLLLWIEGFLAAQGLEVSQIRYAAISTEGMLICIPLPAATS